MSIGVGIVGASPEAGWAFRAHVPALEALAEAGDDVRIAGVLTTREESAAEAARLTGARPYTDVAAMAAAPDVDLVVVTVKVPGHRAAIEAALEEGVDVLCEWPLALDAAEARDLQELAEARGRRLFTGLQARFDPAAEAVGAALAGGEIGPLQAISVRSSRSKGPGEVAARRVYTLDRASGAGAREVHAGHVLDLVDRLAGGVEVLAGGAGVFHRHAVAEGGGDVRITAPDTLAATLATDTALGTLLIWDGRTEAEAEILLFGERGSAAVRSTRGPGLESQVQIGALAGYVETEEGRREIAPAGDDGYAPSTRNVAALYRAVLADRADGGHRAADGHDALRIHRMIERIAA